MVNVMENMTTIIISVPVVFLIFTALIALVMRLVGRSASRQPGGEHEREPYACGQRNVKHYVSPDFTKVFAYAFVFTIMHVLVMVIATAPADSVLMPIAYITAGALVMFLIFKR